MLCVCVSCVRVLYVCREKEEAQRASNVALEEMAHLMFVSSRANGDLAMASKLNRDVADVAIGESPTPVPVPCQSPVR